MTKPIISSGLLLIVAHVPPTKTTSAELRIIDDKCNRQITFFRGEFKDRNPFTGEEPEYPIEIQAAMRYLKHYRPDFKYGRIDYGRMFDDTVFCVCKY